MRRLFAVVVVSLMPLTGCMTEEVDRLEKRVETLEVLLEKEQERNKEERAVIARMIVRFENIDKILDQMDGEEGD